MLDGKHRRRLLAMRRSRVDTAPERTSAPDEPVEELSLLDGRGPVTPVVPPPTGSATYIGRAPVFDRRLDVAGYALIVDHLGEEPGSDRSRQLLTRALLEVGLDSLVGGKFGFLEVTVDLLADGLHHALPGHRIVLEVAGEIDRDGEAILRQVRAEGYRVMLGDLSLCRRPADALRITGGTRVNMRTGGLADTASAIARWQPRAKLLVDGLADDADVDPCRAAGATWMRGDVLRPVERIDEPTVPSNRLAVLELLAELERPDVGVDDIDRLVSTDLGMSYKVLRMANSSYLALERRVERTRDAVVYLGLDTVRAAAALLALSEATDHPPEIVHLSLLRGRHCEEILRLVQPELAHAGFTTGLFSGLDVLLGLSVDQVLQRIPVSDDIAEALRTRRGQLGKVLDVALAYERHDLAALAGSELEPATIVSAYRRALGWVNGITRGLEAPVAH